MWKALDGLSRYIVTPRVAKHRLFAWLDVRILPDSQLIVIAREDDTTFGILHSRFHEVWSLRKGPAWRTVPVTPPPQPSRRSPSRMDSHRTCPRPSTSRIHARRPSLLRRGGSSNSATAGFSS